MTKFESICKTVRETKSRSAWNRGVKLYAAELLENIREHFDYHHLPEEMYSMPAVIISAMLNGAKDWNQYSWGGCSLCYDHQIAKRLSNPSELKKTRGGLRRPNAHEEWLDVQARALWQAADMILRAVRDL